MGVKCVALCSILGIMGVFMGFLEGLLCAASHVPAELKGLFCSICLKALAYEIAAGVSLLRLF